MSLQIKNLLLKLEKPITIIHKYHGITQYARLILDIMENCFYHLQEYFEDCYLNSNRFEFK